MYKAIIILFLSFGFIGCGIEPLQPIEKSEQLVVNQIIDNGFIKIAYNYKVKGPISVSYTLYGEDTVQGLPDREDFYKEPSIPEQYRTKKTDYIYASSFYDTSISYDRGHMASDASFDANERSRHAVYTMANIVPQEKNLNRIAWLEIEKRERYLAQFYGKIKVTNLIKYADMDNILVKRALSTIPSSNSWTAERLSRYKRYDRELRAKKIVIPSSFVKIFEYNGQKECYQFRNIYEPNMTLWNHKIECD